MAKLYIFNPENDLALASGLDYYTAPPMATQLRRDLQMLPALWAEDGAYILSQNIDDDKIWIKNLADCFGINVNLIDGNHLQNHTFEYKPWGWNASIRKQILALCVPAEQLPSPENIATWRDLSHRRTTITIHQQLEQRLGYRLCPIPQEFFTLESITEFANLNYRCFLKAPWSSSGKGIFRPTDTENLTYIYWANGILQRQGSVIGEIPLNKTLDFAMEFLCENKKASFAGYSVFYNNDHNAYESGLATSEERLHRIICQHLGTQAEKLEDIKHALEEILTELVATDYNGYLGIDMLIFTDESGQTSINPCVEMNLRSTMGIVTAILGQRFIHPHSVAHYHCEYHKATFNVKHYIEQKLSENPPVFEVIDGKRKIKTGTMLMAPVYADSRYCAYLEVAESISL